MSSSTSTSRSRPDALRATLRGTALQAAGALLALAVLALAAELVLRVLPSAKGLHRENPSAPASSARLLRSHPYTFSMGWDMRHVVRGRTNAMGFLSPHEYQPGTKP